MGDSCTVFLRVSPPVVVTAQRLHSRYGNPFPEDATFTLEAVGQILGMSSETARHFVWLHRVKLSPPRYYQRRTRGDFRLRRVISLSDLWYLRTVILSRLHGVKGK